MSLDAESAKRPVQNETSHGDRALLSIVNEMDQPFRHARRPSKLFTVINYGNVSTEQIPTSPGVSPRQDIEKFSWPERDSLVHGSHPQIKDLFHSQGKLNHLDVRRGSMLSTSKYPGIKPRVRLVSCTQSFNIPDGNTDDIISIKSTGSHHQLYHKPNLSITDISSITSKPDILPEISGDIRDNKYAVETVRGSAGQMSKTLLDAARMGRLFTKRKTGRIVMKDGTPNITLKDIKTRNQKFMIDIFTTVLDMQWRWVLFLFCVAFVFSWLAFAGKHTPFFSPLFPF